MWYEGSVITSERGDRSQGTPRAARLLGALAIGAGFGAATAFMNALALGHADLESRAYTTSGWSYPEIISVLLDSGWAWAGCGVAVGWAVTRGGDGRRTAPALGAVAAALALLAATIAYGIGEAVADGGQTPWFGADELVWGTASIVLGAPLGAIGACARRPGAVGLLARLTVPVGAAVQMVVQPPGRNEVLTAIGQWVVWTVALVSIAVVLVHFIRTRPMRTA